MAGSSAVACRLVKLLPVAVLTRRVSGGGCARAQDMAMFVQDGDAQVFLYNKGFLKHGTAMPPPEILPHIALDGVGLDLAQPGVGGLFVGIARVTYLPTFHSILLSVEGTKLCC